MRRRPSSQIIVGLLFMALGGALTLDNLGVVAFGSLWRYSPVVLIAMGVSRFFEAPRRAREGVYLILIGTWTLLNMLEILRWRESWPLVIVALGISMVVRAMSGADERHRLADNGDGQDDASGTLGGVQ